MKHELTRTDAGSQRTLHVGDTVEVTLPEMPTSGFTWQPEIDSHELEQIGDERHTSSAVPGAAGMRIVTFRATGPGEATLRLVNRRRWESETHDEFSVRLTIIAAGPSAESESAGVHYGDPGQTG